jgi:WD40 repeat protein
MVNMRLNKSLILSLLIAFALTNQVYCQEEDQKEQAFKKVQSLVEFKDTVSKIDSLKQSGHKIDVNVVAIWESILPEDSTSSIALYYLNEVLFNKIENPIYLIKFDKIKNEIVSVEGVGQISIE